jgi:hypothetical protein
VRIAIFCGFAMTLFSSLLTLIGARADDGATASSRREVENRRAVRRPQRMREGFIWCPAKPAFPPQPCRIRDMSLSGARVETIEALPPDVPWSAGVRLYLATEAHELNCRVAWRRDRSLGLHFQSSPMPPSRQYR